ncbi:MAG TPA: MHYT domain-containing protein [Gemmatimonadales bacterium]|jgi:PAS domain S-box-containing protein|nr:MHYT domain-containing protein [Gemmatimonadales bacterium]
MDPHMLHASHAPTLVVLSFAIAICASYTALTLAGRVAVARGRARLAWLMCGSIAMGSGIWSMHFVAMLAFHLPISIAYDVPLVTASWLAAVAASAFALWVAGRTRVGVLGLACAGACLGLAVVTMHYTGMAAMRVTAQLSYDPVLVGASVLIAVVASTVALLLFRWLRNDYSRRGSSLRAAAAVVMGVAIAGMHYTAMAAARFSDAGSVALPSGGMIISATGLAVPVVMGAIVILTLTVIGTITDHWVRVQLSNAEALRESEERYRSVVSEVDEVIFRTDVAGNWTFLNPAWKTITGFSPNESLGTPHLNSVHQEDRATSAGQYTALAEGSTEFSRHEVRYRTRDGGSRWVEVHARASHNPNGELVGTAGVIRDVTDRRRAEEALRAASQAAEAASRAKSEFLSRMSHELRTPLNAILGFGQLMELEATTEGQKESAAHVLKAGQHLLHLINEVLDITGIESGGLRVSAEPVRVMDTVSETLDLMGPMAAARHVELSADESAMTERWVQADRQRLKQILLNLVANAVKYNRVGGTVRVTCEPGHNRSVRVVVTDTGHGIPADRLPRMFTAFDRLGAEQTDVEGTGLGLALARRLAEVMHGTIGVKTEVGVGSAFWIELPAAESESARWEAMSHNTPLPMKAVTGRTRKILYVEDNLSNLTLVQRILAQRPDIELIPAMQGSLALDLARVHRPHMILLDLHLPDMPGEDVLRMLRQRPDCRNIPVVVLSADATPGQTDKLLAAGAHSYITKPLDVKPFIRLVDEVLAHLEAA